MMLASAPVKRRSPPCLRCQRLSTYACILVLGISATQCHSWLRLWLASEPQDAAVKMRTETPVEPCIATEYSTLSLHQVALQKQYTYEHMCVTVSRKVSDLQIWFCAKRGFRGAFLLVYSASKRQRGGGVGGRQLSR